MEIPDAVAWLLLGTALGITLVLLAGLLVRRAGRGRPPGPSSAPPPAAGFAEDDLPGFRESPPGAPGAAAHRDRTGWVALSGLPPAPAPASVPEPGPDRSTARVLAAMAAAALLLIGAAAVVAATGDDRTQRRGDEPAREPAPRSAVALAGAQLVFGGVVLERQAVGVTVTYPVVELVAGAHASRVAVELPTFNCLTAEAPPDPAAAGCLPGMPEYAELAEPLLVLDGDGDRVRFGGRFATVTRPNGGPPQPTGRVYELAITVEPRAGEPRAGWLAAEGVLVLGADRTATTGGPGLSRLRYR
jgi:hypothetical protein